MKLNETTTVSAGNLQNVSSLNTSKSSWTNNPVVLWAIIGIVVICLGFVSWKYITMPNIDKIQKEANEWKAKYESIIKEYEMSKNVYEDTLKILQKKFDTLNNEYSNAKKVSKAKISEIQKKYDTMKKEFDRIQKEGQNVQKPKTSKERVDRLRALGYPPVQ
jgi:predicted negative regulator of RcsB-dependent stress response